MPQGPEFILIRANGRWLFPKGNLEEGETPEAAALREIAEETGLPSEGLRIVGQLPSISYAFQWEGQLVFKTVHNFLVEAQGEEPPTPQLSEVEAVGWFSADVARQTLSFKNSEKTLEAAIAAVESLRVSG